MKRLCLTLIAFFLLAVFPWVAWGVTFQGVSLTGVSTITPVAYGVKWDTSASSPALTKGIVTSSGTFLPTNYTNYPVQQTMRRVVLNSAGVWQYNLSETDSTKKDTGAAANIDGTDGQEKKKMGQK